MSFSFLPTKFSKFLRIAKQLGLLSVAQRQVLVENMLEKDFDTQSYYDRGVCGNLFKIKKEVSIMSLC